MDGTDHLYIITTLVNTGNETLNVLKDPRTAMTSTPTDIFSITNLNCTIPDFIGSIVSGKFPLGIQLYFLFFLLGVFTLQGRL